MDIYGDIILDNYKNPKNFGKLKHPQKTVEVNNPLCGDKIFIDVNFYDDKIEDIKFSGEACAISKAAASMLTEYARGKKISHLKKLDPSFMVKLLKIDLSPNRIKCALLPLEGLHKLIYGKSKS